MKDEAKPVVVKTGDDTDYKSLSALLIASGLLIAAVICKIKRGKDEQESEGNVYAVSHFHYLFSLHCL